MKTVQGNFMAEPRVFAHSARNITPSSESIPLIDERGVALYIGSGGDVIVRMEGTHVSTDPVGNPWVTNICVFRNVPDGLFMPVLVTHVLENNEEEWKNYIAFYENLGESLSRQIEQMNKLITKLNEQEAVLREEIEVAKFNYDKNCAGGNPRSKSYCSNLQKTINNLKDQLSETQRQKEDATKQLDQLQEDANTNKQDQDTLEKLYNADPSPIIETTAENIVALY